MKSNMPTDFDLDMIHACRYAYYVLHRSIMDDMAYDVMEKNYVLVNGPVPVGSERKEDYTEAQRALALYFLLSNRRVEHRPADSLL